MHAADIQITTSNCFSTSNTKTSIKQNLHIILGYFDREEIKGDTGKWEKKIERLEWELNPGLW